MMKWEERLREWICAHAFLFAYIAVFVLGVFCRYSYLPILSRDLEVFNGPWLEALKGGDLRVVLNPALEFNYSPLYLYMWAIAAKVLARFDTYTVLKCLSWLMECGLVVCAMLLIRALTQSKLRRFLGFAALWLHPVLLWNVSAWGQTDALYISFCVLSLLLLETDHPKAGLCVLGLALSWKLQALFLMPIYLYAYFSHPKKFSLLWFLVPPAIWLATGLPLVALGFSPLWCVKIYLGQAELYAKKITYNYPNLYAMLGFAMGRNSEWDGMISRSGIAMLITLYGSVFVYITQKRTQLKDRGLMTLLSSWCVLIAVFFLPRMHERYGLMGEILLLCWAVAQSGWLPWLCVIASVLPILSAYMDYLFKYPMFPLQIGGFIQLALIAVLTWQVFTGLKQAPVELR